MAHEHLKPKAEYRDPVLDGKVNDMWRHITQPRGAVEHSVQKIEELIASEWGEQVLNSFNLPKEELMKQLNAYRALLASSEDLC
jgi:hypothetical protein